MSKLEDRCDCPNPECNGKLTMVRNYSKRYGTWWTCELCKNESAWSWTR